MTIEGQVGETAWVQPTNCAAGLGSRDAPLQLESSSTAREAASDLFRQDAIAAAQDRLGSPVRPAGVGSWTLTFFMVTLLIAAVAFLCLSRYSRRETVSGTLQPAAGALRVSASRSGMIADVSIREGQEIVAGQSLITISSDPSVGNGARLGELLSNATDSQYLALNDQAQAQRDLVARQRDALAARRAALVDQRRRLAEDVQLQKQRVELADQSAEAARALWAQQLISALQYRQREEALIIAKQGLSAVERELASIPSSLAELVAEDGRLIALASQNDALSMSSRAQLEEKRAINRADASVVLISQGAGQVAALQAKPGASVSAGQTLALVLPRGAKLQAELWVPSRAAGFVRPGDKVRLMYDAFPYQRFGVGRGRVIEVAKAPTAPSDVPAAIKTDEALYRVVVELESEAVNGYGKAWTLSPGMRLTADLVLEQQSLWAWLTDKVRAAQARAEPI